jgi:hypothetical protein
MVSLIDGTDLESLMVLSRTESLVRGQWCEEKVPKLK